MRHISHKTVYIKNPDTNEYEGLPALRGEQGLSGTDVASIHVGEDEPTNENCVAWITPEGSSSVNLPEINDGEINAVDTWSSEKINNEFNNQKTILTTEIQQRDRVVNLLDNSDFRKQYFIAQAGLNGLHGTMKHVGDRWITWNADATFTDGYITPGSPIDQRLDPAVIDMAATYTAAIWLSDGTVRVASGNFTSGFGSYNLGIYCPPSTTQPYVRLNTGFNIRWAALYEGAYTADTLPEYQPKGYEAELAECRWYFQRLIKPTATGLPAIAGFGTAASSTAFVICPLPVPMREGIPTIIHAGLELLNERLGTYLPVSSVTAYGNQAANNVLLQVTTTGALTAGEVYYLVGKLSGSYLDVSRDL
jgi:hypothetical protein